MEWGGVLSALTAVSKTTMMKTPYPLSLDFKELLVSRQVSDFKHVGNLRWKVLLIIVALKSGEHSVNSPLLVASKQKAWFARLTRRLSVTVSRIVETSLLKPSQFLKTQHKTGNSLLQNETLHSKPSSLFSKLIYFPPNRYTQISYELLLHSINLNT